MQTRLKMLHDWNHQLRRLLPGVRSTRVDVLALFALGVLWAGSVTLLRVASRLPLAATDMSTERRLRRWLANGGVDAAALWRPIAAALLAGVRGEVVLALDPTPHGPRRTVIVLGIVAHRRVLPLAWRVVPGQASWDRPQIEYFGELCRAVAGYLSAECVVTLVADKGLTSRELVGLCEGLGWHYVLRLSADAKQGHNVRLPDGTERPVWGLTTGRGQRLYEGVEIFKRGGWVRAQLSIYWGEGYDEPWILLSDRPAGQGRVREYRRRWRAEATYQDCKKRGWDVERSKVAEGGRLERLLLVLFVALWWAEALGMRVVRRGLRRRFDRGGRRDLSLARLGARWLHHLLDRDRPHPLLFRPVSASWRFTWLF